MKTRSPTAAGDPAGLSTSDPTSARYRARNIVERCFNRLDQWRGIATRTDKTAHAYDAAITRAAILIWIKTDLVNTP
jgi:hypothetical protein